LKVKCLQIVNKNDVNQTLKLTPHGSVASDNVLCSQFGVDMLKMGGNAVDAAITTTLCNSVVLPHLSGLGGYLKLHHFKIYT